MSPFALALLLGVAADIAPVEHWSIDAPVTDRFGTLSNSERDQISKRLEAHYGETGVQMAVLIVDTTAGVPIEDFSIRAAEAWAGGTKENNAGVLFVLAMHDRRMRLEVGYGIEPYLTDGEAARLIYSTQQDMRAGRVAAAINLVVDGVINETKSVEFDMGVIRKPFRLPVPLGFPPEQSLPFLLGVVGAVALLVLRKRARARAPGVLTIKSKKELNDPKLAKAVGSSRVDLQACKLEYSIVSPK